jgi:hypothetical protein
MLRRKNRVDVMVRLDEEKLLLERERIELQRRVDEHKRTKVEMQQQRAEKERILAIDMTNQGFVLTTRNCMTESWSDCKSFIHVMFDFQTFYASSHLSFLQV